MELLDAKTNIYMCVCVRELLVLFRLLFVQVIFTK